jgi:hypothetical protein
MTTPVVGRQDPRIKPENYPKPFKKIAILYNSRIVHKVDKESAYPGPVQAIALPYSIPEVIDRDHISNSFQVCR